MKLRRVAGGWLADPDEEGARRLGCFIKCASEAADFALGHRKPEVLLEHFFLLMPPGHVTFVHLFLREAGPGQKSPNASKILSRPGKDTPLVEA